VRVSAVKTDAPIRIGVTYTRSSNDSRQRKQSGRFRCRFVVVVVVVVVNVSENVIQPMKRAGIRNGSRRSRTENARENYSETSIPNTFGGKRVRTTVFVGKRALRPIFHVGEPFVSITVTNERNKCPRRGNETKNGIIVGPMSGPSFLTICALATVSFSTNIFANRNEGKTNISLGPFFLYANGNNGEKPRDRTANKYYRRVLFGYSFW